VDVLDQPSWRAIAQEAALAAEHIGIGATTLGRANYGLLARYPQAFFALSVGFERSSKLAIALDYALDHGGLYPDSNQFRAYGHDIARLLRDVDDIASRRGLDLRHGGLPKTTIHRAIFQTLSEFARNVTRYYNLEVLAAGDRDVQAKDPIAAWHERITVEVLNRHYTDAQRQREEVEVALGEATMGARVMVRHVDETGALLSSVTDAMRATRRAAAARPWERMYVLQLGRFLGAVLGQLGLLARRHGMAVPELREFFAVFNQDDATLRRLRVWTISY